ncbi:HAMP domain-containing histidine kinase [candidate division WWE3 bacterium]|nr:HAMP domain-containing histidine kinase [candidate division WWE3 bacterium]
MFESARLKLTAWYLAIIAILSLSFSLLVYQGIRGEINRTVSEQRENIELISHGTVTIDSALEDKLQRRVLLNMFLIDIVILILTGGAGYLLAGKTMRPIEAMLEEQKRFVSDASHELRTPLTALATSTEVALRDKNLSMNEAREVLQSNLDDVSELQDLINHLLELARFQQNKEPEQLDDVALDDAIESGIQKVKHLAEQKNIHITAHLLPVRIKAHSSRITELIIILLDNAIKYSSPDKKITIDVHDTKNNVIIEVRDQGIGISPDELPHIFDRFYRVDQSRNRTCQDGYGLGLSIAQKIVHAYKGSINVTSKANEGSLFTIMFPQSSLKK